MSDQENKEKKYIRYTAEELATVPSPYQMERELGPKASEEPVSLPTRRG